MANELVQGLLQNLLQPQQPQGPNPADIVTALNSRNPAATMAAIQAPQLGQMFGQQFRGLIGGITGNKPLTANEAMAAATQQVAAQPGLMDSSVGLNQLARAAATVGRTAEAMQFSLMASQKKAEEDAQAKREAAERQAITQQSLARNTNILAVENTIAGVDQEKNPGLYNALLGYRQQLAGEATPTNPDKAQETITGLFTRYKVELPKAEPINYLLPSGDIKALATNEYGQVTMAGPRGQLVTNTPAALGLTIAPQFSTVSTREDKTPEPAFIEGAVQRAQSLNLLPEDPNSPAGKSFMAYLRAGNLTSYEDIPKFFEGVAATPAAQQAQRDFRMNVANETSTVVQTANNVLDILNNPNNGIGVTWSLLADYPVESSARRLQQAVGTLKAQVTFEKIQDLKEKAAASGSTGTGLGSVAVTEFEALGNSLVNLEAAQNPETLRDAANRVMLHTINGNNALNGRPIMILREEINTVYPQRAFLLDPRTNEISLDMGVGDPVPVVLFENAEAAVASLQPPPL
jgi:hypothetical protein